MDSIGQMAIQVSWVAPNDQGAPITGYQLWMAENEKSFELVWDGRNRADLLTFTVADGVKITNIYHFKLHAINYVGSSVASEILSVICAVVPSAPRNL